MSVPWETEVAAPLVEFFGGTAKYFPNSGAASFDVVGVFDEGYRETTVIEGLDYTSDATPMIGINEAQFAAKGINPGQSDRVKITDPLAKAFGVTFIVNEVRPDSHGLIRLMMNKADVQL